MARRVVAALLCAAMVFSSESFSMAAMAAPAAAEAQAEDAEGQTEEKSDPQTEEPVLDKEGDIQTEKENMPDEAMPDETAASETAPDETTSDETTSSEAVSDGNEADESAADDPDQAADGAEAPDVTEDIVPADGQETEEVDLFVASEADEGEEPAVPAPLFKVDENGVLAIDNESAFPADGKIEIPREAKKIPAGIFNAEAYIDKVKEVTFASDSLLECIGENAFEGSKITGIAIPKSVAVIESAAFKKSALAEITFPEDSLTASIGSEAFAGTELTALGMPAVTEIGDSAFEGCGKLVDVDAPALVTIGKSAFKGCAKLNPELKWPVGLKAIGESAFDGCGFITLDMSSIRTEDISIGTGAFDNCEALVAVTALPEHLKTVSAMFRGCDKLGKIVLPAEVTEIGESAFEDVQIKSMAIPAGVTKIEAAVFKNTPLAEITFGGKVTSIGKEAFLNTSVTSIDASCLVEVGQSAFDGCGKLETFKEADSVELIGAYAFRGCSSLSEFSWSEKLKSIGREAFAGCKFTDLSLGVIESEGISIDSGAFSGCTALTEVKSLPRNLKIISSSLFKGCEKLTNVQISGSVTAIQADAFADCKAISTVILPANVSVIRAGAFSGCEGLKTVTIQNPDPDGDNFVLEDGAFPKVTPDKCTMKGYGGKVEIFAEKNGYKYESLFRSYNVSYSKDLAKNVEVMLSHEKDVTPGTDVTVTFKPKQGYTLMEDSVKLYCDHISPQPTAGLLNYTDTTILYQFKMPEDDVQIEFTVKKLEEAVTGKISARITPALETDEQEIMYFEKAGQTAQIKVLDSASTVVGAWLLDYKSTDPDVISVSNKGELLTKRQGNATISVSVKGDTANKVTFKMRVKASTVIDTLVLNNPKTMNPLNLRRASVTQETMGGTEYTVVQFDISSLQKTQITFDVSFNAYEKDDLKHNYFVQSKWKSSDKEVASVASETSINNSNRVTVKKGAMGQSLITFSVQNAGSSTPVTGGLLIRVVDATPRLAEDKLTVNAASSAGTSMDIVFVHGFDIREGTDLDVYQKRIKSGTEHYDLYEGLVVDYSKNGKYYLRATSALSLSKGKTLRYKGDKKLYLRGIFKDGSEFYIPIPDLSIVRKALKPTIKTSGKVNMYFKGKDENGVGMKLTQSLDDEVAEIRLMSEANYKKEIKNKVPDPDPFCNNFMITPIDNKTYSITWTGNDLERTKSGKLVNTGYVAIRYKGNDGYFYKKIKVSTENKKPSYELSMTSVTAYANSALQTYELRVLDKNTGSVLNLGDVAELYLSDAESTPGLFNNISPESVRADEKLNGMRSIIPLTLSGAAAEGKAVIVLRLNSWNETERFTFTMNVTSEVPVAALTKQTLTLNTLYPAMKVTTRAKLNGNPEEKDYVGVYLDKSALEYIAEGSKGEDADRIMDSMAFNSDGSITVSLPENAAVGGEYNYRITPRVQYGASSLALSPLTFKVTVTDAQPGVSVHRSETLKGGGAIYDTIINHAGAAIEDVEIYEEVETGKPYTDVNGRRISPHFTVSLVDGETGRVCVRTENDETGISRSAVLCFKLKDVGNLETRINIEPEKNEKIPKKMKAKALGSYIYVGQNKSRSIEVQLETTDKNIKDIPFAAPAFAAGTSKTLKQAFKATVNPLTGVMSLTLVDPSVLVLNKKYTITFENRYLGQPAAAKGQKFKVSVTIRK